MIKIILLLCAYVAFTNEVTVTRTNDMIWVNIKTSRDFRGITVKQTSAGYEIEWLEDFDISINPLLGYFNYIFEESGHRQVINIDNLCGTYGRESIEHAVQQYMLLRFANTTQCPIKKGTKVIYKLPETFSWQTENRECGLVDGGLYLKKKKSRRSGHTPFLLRVFLSGNVTGPECAN